MKKIFLVFSFYLLLLLAASAQETRRVLFIGNSYTEVNNLPAMVQQIASSMGNALEYSQNTPGGCTFQQHLQNASLDLIRQGGWDVVVLQEQSQLPSFPPDQVARECFPYAAQLVEEVYAANPEGEAMFYMTWGRRDGDQENAQYYPPLGTYEGMDSLLYDRYMYMAQVNDASVCPVGRVWRRLREQHSDIELYASDGSHPSMAGTYAAATAFYTMIFHRSLADINFCPEGVGEETAATIRQMVQQVVFDSLDMWLRAPMDTTHTDTTHTDTTQADTVAILQCTTLSTTLSIHPNPCHAEITLEVAESMLPCLAEIYTLEGRKVRSLQLTKTATNVDMLGLPASNYIIKTGSQAIMLQKL